MKLSFYGAAREVTGSKHLLEVNGKKILLDCGLFQGHRKEAAAKNKKFEFEPTEIDAVILSHAHIDHSGSLPKLGKEGFNGPIYSTFSTRDLCQYMLMDSAYIQEREAEYINEKKRRKGEPMVEPDYNAEDAEKVLQQFEAIGYRRPKEIFPGVTLTLYNSGHILGSELIYLEIKDQEDGKTKTLLFTGDLGRKNLPILKDPYQVDQADILVMESTYGNRFHEAIVDVENRLADIINATIKRGGKIIIPAFSLGRTQEIVYELHKLCHDGRIPADLPIWVDSPLSGNLTEVFRAHPEDFDKEAQEEFIEHQDDPFGFGRLKYTKSVEESKALNDSTMPMIIISASGMCEHGRILHHLRNNIEDSRNTMIAIGFMAEGTLGRRLIEKEKEVKIFGDPYKVRMHVEVINAFSGHADRSDLLDYATRIKGLKKVFLVHGEEGQGQDLKNFLAENDINDVTLPYFGETYTL